MLQESGGQLPDIPSDPHVSSFTLCGVLFHTASGWVCVTKRILYELGCAISKIVL